MSRLLVLLFLGLVPRLLAGQASNEAFPHAPHAKLFPTCNGCHAGVTTGNMQAVMPPPALCAECHNGVDAKRVRYDAPTPRSDFVRFEHREHATHVPAEGRECATCHAMRPDAPWMHVASASQATCEGCHAHRASSHLAADSRCATCHVPLARAASLTAARIAAFPKPPSHAADRFLERHAVSSDTELASCATCHARESCARCHVNAANVAAINNLLPDARVAAMLRSRTASYFTPDDHRAAAWEIAHGTSAAAAPQRCAACHARPSCTACHTGAMGMSVIRLLSDGRTGAPGVQLVLPRRVRPVSGAGAPRRSAELAAQPHREVGQVADTGRVVVRVHPPSFERTHAAQAASERLTCEGCHTQRFCSDCHAGETRRRFHPANFVARHAPESYGREMECSSCHNTEVFCRACHQASGLVAGGRGSGGYHNAQPLWLLQHGAAARQGLPGCVTCHVQRDCMQCHANTGWGVSPHGPNFDASRLGQRAQVMCARCHIAEPTRRR